MGLLLIAPFGGLVLVAFKITDYSIKKGIRLLGLITCISLGGLSIYWGYILTFQGMTDIQGTSAYLIKYPFAGWFGMIIGGATVLFGSVRSLFTAKEQVYAEEAIEKMKKEAQVSAKISAKEMLKNGRIDDNMLYDRVMSILRDNRGDYDSHTLALQLADLAIKQQKLNQK